METLSDLEASAIGDIQKYESCTAHFIRTCFRNSPAKRFSDSAGSVYPMMKRLEARGLIESVVKKEGQRKVRYYQVTESGREALRLWIGPPVSDSAMLTVDPLRTRMLYLGHISKANRRRWFEELETMLNEKLEAISDQKRTHPADSPDLVFLKLADENAMMEIKTRLKWLAKAKQQLRAEGIL